jgi:hypothetical protein
MKKAWGLGAAILLIAHAQWFALLFFQARADWFMPLITPGLLLMMNIAGIAALVTARRAPRRRFLLAMTMAPLTAVLSVLSNLGFERFGQLVDFSGVRGAVGLFGVTLAYGIFVSAIGGAIGVWWAGRRVAEAPPLTTTESTPQP